MDYMESILQPIQAQFDEFQQYYQSVNSSSDPHIDTLLKFLLQRKGKMLRPILVFLVAKHFGTVSPSIFKLAASVEMLHQASLIHDDVVDESDLRRGKPSVNSAYGNKLAVLLGDYVVSQALQQITATDSIQALDQLSKLIGSLSQGEILQIQALDSTKLDENVYYDIIRLKTAGLFTTSANLSALLSGANTSEAACFADFATKAGMCFQIMDDILDFHDSKTTGKPSGEDLSEGKFTLPVICALNSSDRDWSQEISQIRSLSASAQTIQLVRDFTVSSGGIDQAIQIMQQLKQQALNALPHDMEPQLQTAFSAYLSLITDRLA